jgi:hypothetical protein
VLALEVQAHAAAAGTRSPHGSPTAAGVAHGPKEVAQGPKEGPEVVALTKAPKAQATKVPKTQAAGVTHGPTAGPQVAVPPAGEASPSTPEGAEGANPPTPNVGPTPLMALPPPADPTAGEGDPPTPDAGGDPPTS